MKVKKESGLIEFIENAVRYRDEEGDLNWYERKTVTRGIPLTICILLTVYFSKTQPPLMKVFLIIAALLLFIYSLMKIKKLLIKTQK